ncbi:hypothetical protein [Pontibacter russatus]|uniref:hypothetical protein n=1 Tax=Pontibacter russatus TaxID=2694929 RepID=UPI00192A43B0|nr:hypothetical protein [Pontibacter russatus]
MSEESETKNYCSKYWEDLFSKYHSLTAKEFSELSGTPRIESSEKLLTELSDKRALEIPAAKKGAVGRLKNTSR